MLRLAAVAIGVALGAAAPGCKFPPPSSNFTSNTYTGVWYEIGRVQTPGGAFFQRNCVCTQLVVGPYSPGGNATVENKCRSKTPDGPITEFNGTLANQSPPGHWVETFFAGVPGVNYTVIEIGADYSVEYDCKEGVLGPQYCIHILSRTPTLPQAQVQSLLAIAEGQGLNPEGIAYKQTQQDGCWKEE